MNALFLRSLVLFLALSAGWASTAAELGMVAPPLKIQEWLKGKPVQVGVQGDTNIYVIEFWATWCGPCRVSIPHLTALQKQFASRGVLFIGVSNEDAATVKPFLKEMGSKMDYTIAVDQDQGTTLGYMAAFDVPGIPHAFVVGRDGRVLWEGHPMMGLDKVIEEVLAGTYDIKRAKVSGQFMRDAQQYHRIVATAGSTPEAVRLGNKILTEAKDHPSLLQSFATMILTDARIRNRDLKLALNAAQAASTAATNLEPAYLQTYARALSDNGQPQRAIEIQKKAISLTQNPEDRKFLESGLQDYQKRNAADK
jgi:thiol-disulfide isomerase/thioredoxin